MKLSKKEQALLAAAGVTLTDDDFVEKPSVHTEEHTKEMAKWEAQSVLRSLKWPYPELVNRQCERPDCKKIFLTNYEANAYCSMECFKIELERRGLVWRPERSFYEQWGNLEPPLMIPPEAIRAMRRLLMLVDQGNPVVSGSLKQDHEVLEQEEDIPLESELPEHSIPSSDPDIPEEHEKDSDDDFLALLDAQDD